VGQRYCAQICAVEHVTARRAEFRPTRLGAKGLLEAADMLAELEASCLEVVLIPSGDPNIASRGGMIRAVQSANPEWYQDFCSQYSRARRSRKRTPNHDTIIDRRATLAALRRLVDRLEVSGVYGARLEEFIEGRLRHANNFIFQGGGRMKDRSKLSDRIIRPRDLNNREERPSGFVSCSWCHELNGPIAEFCHNCGHCAHVPRAQCYCRECKRRTGVLVTR
jgi:hypothetical protein